MAERAPSEVLGANTGSTVSAQGFKLTIAIMGVIFAVTLYGQLPRQIVAGWFATRASTYSVIWPQHWSFFTNTADSDLLTAYRIGPDGKPVFAVTAQMSGQNMWGFGSVSTVEFNELDTLASGIPALDWTSCDDTDEPSCISEARTVDLSNTFQPAILCGLLVIARFPAAAAVAAPTPAGPYRGSIVLVSVTCSP